MHGHAGGPDGDGPAGVAVHDPAPRQHELRIGSDREDRQSIPRTPHLAQEPPGSFAFELEASRNAARDVQKKCKLQGGLTRFDDLCHRLMPAVFQDLEVLQAQVLAEPDNDTLTLLAGFHTFHPSDVLESS